MLSFWKLQEAATINLKGKGPLNIRVFYTKQTTQKEKSSFINNISPRIIGRLAPFFLGDKKTLERRSWTSSYVSYSNLFQHLQSVSQIRPLKIEHKSWIPIHISSHWLKKYLFSVYHASSTVPSLRHYSKSG